LISLRPFEVRVVVHGSFRRHFDQILEAIEVFKAAGFTVLAPEASDIIASTDGFAVLKGEEGLDPRYIEARYLHNLKRLGRNGFSYFVNPKGYIGRSTSYEWGIASLTNTRCFFMARPADHPGYLVMNSVWSPRELAAYILEFKMLPAPRIDPNEYEIHRLWQRLVVPGSTVAVGAIIEYAAADEAELLFVKTHKWGGRYSMIGEKVGRGERLDEALVRGIREETGLRAKVGRHIVTFDQLKGSGYYQAHVNHIFSDYVVKVDSKRVVLDDEAQDHVWLTGTEAIQSLNLEPNARNTLKLYLASRR
jgi:ADP-ribose pyrophosphatase YjhB (NUDIX family)